MDTVIDALVAANYENALARLDQETSFLSRSLPVLLADKTHATHAAAACLFRVRAHLGMNDPLAASAAANECVRQAPLHKPALSWHPPAVREAVRALLADDTCPSSNDTDCPQPGGLCRNVGGLANRCTYACGNPNQCDDPIANPSGSTCGPGTTGGEDYCGG